MPCGCNRSFLFKEVFGNRVYAVDNSRPGHYYKKYNDFKFEIITYLGRRA